MSDIPNIFNLIIVLALLGVMSLLIVVATSFIKIAVVFSLLRSALGVQQIPPNIALYGLALMLTAYIMAPVGFQIADYVSTHEVSIEKEDSFAQFLDEGLNAYRDFLIKEIREPERVFFLETAENLWPQAFYEKLEKNSLFVLLPAFTISELTRAFEIGFLIYLPFIVIDLIVSNILLAMGMMMVSPMTISLPFKLLLFVLLNGWTKLTHGLVLSYS